jgi:molybdopterin molybdotransferase
MQDLAEIFSNHSGIDMPVDLVLNALAKLATPIDASENVAIMDALGRIVFSDVISDINVPAHDNSAMDGYAFDGAILGSTSHDVELKMVGTILAGQVWSGAVGLGECLKIMTGGLMPKGLNTVIPHEMCQIDSQGLVRFSSLALQSGSNQRLQGEDLKKGQIALRKGTRITPAAAGMLASLGQPKVQVYRPLNVAYFSTGNEILSLGEPPREGAVYDSNRYTIIGLLANLGCKVIDLGVVRDDPKMLKETWVQAAQQADVIITSGGVSTGDADHTKAMMQALGDMVFLNVAMRPGRPLALGTIKQGTHAAILFGLPGNPVAAMVSFLAFVKPTLLKMMGCTDSPQPLMRARSQGDLPKKPGRTEFQRGVVSRNAQGELQVSSTGSQGSGLLSSMVQANGLMVLHHDQSTVRVGDWVDVMML